MSKPGDISVHDNRLVSYEVLCAQREIRLCTEYRDRGEPFEFTDVIFTGVVAYDFFYDSQIGTIIFDIEETPPGDLYAQYAEEFHAGVRYGWPGWWAESAEAAAAYFQENATRAFELSSSCGMCGWVLAREMRIVSRV